MRLIQSYYVLDAKNVILEVGGSWDSFARANEGSQATSEHVVGTSLWSNINSDLVRMQLEATLMRARLSKAPMIGEYDCHGPFNARFAAMRFEIRPKNQLMVHHDLFEMNFGVESKSPVASPKRKTIRCCSMCDHVTFGERQIPKSDFPKALTSKLFFGLCDACTEPGAFANKFDAAER